MNGGRGQQIDDGGRGVNGKSRHCQILCNPLYTAYFTTAKKDRLTILDVLRNGRERTFRINAEAFRLLDQFGVSQRVQQGVRQLPLHQDWSESELNRRLADQIPDLGV